MSKMVAVTAFSFFVFSVPASGAISWNSRERSQSVMGERCATLTPDPNEFKVTVSGVGETPAQACRRLGAVFSRSIPISAFGPAGRFRSCFLVAPWAAIEARKGCLLDAEGGHFDYYIGGVEGDGLCLSSSSLTDGVLCRRNNR